MSDKLKGDEYLAFWKTRIAKSPEEVAYTGSTPEQSEAHADQVMAELEPLFAHIDPVLAQESDPGPVIAELGCGWGRMSTRLAKRFPKAFVHGFDICPEAVGGAGTRAIAEGLDGRMNFALASEIPPTLAKHVDLVFTCTCLQHITDDEYFEKAMRSIREGMRPHRGFALLFENTHVPDGPAGRHVRFRGPQDFLRWFEIPEGEFEYMWSMDKTVLDHGERHQSMLIRRHAIRTR